MAMEYWTMIITTLSSRDLWLSFSLSCLLDVKEKQNKITSLFAKVCRGKELFIQNNLKIFSTSLYVSLHLRKPKESTYREWWPEPWRAVDQNWRNLTNHVVTWVTSFTYAEASIKEYSSWLQKLFVWYSGMPICTCRDSWCCRSFKTKCQGTCL